MVGSVLDGIPESFVLGLTVLQGGVSVALLVGVVLTTGTAREQITRNE